MALGVPGGVDEGGGGERDAAGNSMTSREAAGGGGGEGRTHKEGKPEDGWIRTDDCCRNTDTSRLR